MKTLTLVLFFVLLSLVCGFGNAAVLYQNESQQIQISDQIIYGNIVGVTSAWNPQKTHIETTAQVLVNTTLKNIGNTTIGPGTIVTVTVPGGAVGNDTEWVEDMPVLLNNTEGIFFLKKGSDGKNSVLNIIPLINGKTEKPDSQLSASTFEEFKQKISAVLQGTISSTPLPIPPVPATTKAGMIFAPVIAVIGFVILIQTRRERQ